MGGPVKILRRQSTQEEAFELMPFNTGQRSTTVVDCETGSAASVLIRPVEEKDMRALESIGNAYKPCGPGKNMSYVMVSQTPEGDVVEGALQVTPGIHLNAKSLSVDGIDAAPHNMRDADGRKLSHVGARLLEHAIRISQEKGLNGRLHMHPRDAAARMFYRNYTEDRTGLTKGKDGLFHLSAKAAPRLKQRIDDEIVWNNKW